MANILVFGDSIVQGFWDIEGGWVARLRKFLDEKSLQNAQLYYFSLFNLGISGDNSDDLVERFETELISRLDEEEETIIIFAIGINDSYYINPEKRFNVELEKYKQNLSTLLTQAKKYSKKIVFLGLTPIDETKTDPIPWSPTKSYRKQFVNSYNDAITEFCKNNSINFVSLIDKLEVKEDSEDGLHPNSRGHEKIYDIVRNYLLAKEIIEILS